MAALKITDVRAVSVKAIPKETLQLIFHVRDASKHESIQVDLEWRLALAAVEAAAKMVGLLGDSTPPPPTRDPSGGRPKLRIVK
jgi:hypothetical protein